MSLCLLLLVTCYYYKCNLPRVNRKRKRGYKYSLKGKMSSQARFIRRLTRLEDSACKDILRMNRASFNLFCELVCKEGGLRASKYVSVPEKVASFLAILGHHFKNRVAKFLFRRSGQTISRYFHEVLRSVLKLHGLLVPKPEKVPADCSDDPWRHFPVSVCLEQITVRYVSIRSF